MTTNKKHKRRVRDRMALTGETYSEALRQTNYSMLLSAGAEMPADPQTPEGQRLAQMIAEARVKYRATR